MEILMLRAEAVLPTLPEVLSPANFDSDLRASSGKRRVPSVKILVSIRKSRRLRRDRPTLSILDGRN